MHFYSLPGNSNGKMSQGVYITQILEPIVQPWIEDGRDFVLKEDGDSGHGPSKSNPVRSWKEEHGLEFYFNYAASPDLAPIENRWQPAKVYLRKFPRWDDRTMKELILEGWAEVKQDSINQSVRSMPDRLQAVIALK